MGQAAPDPSARDGDRVARAGAPPPQDSPCGARSPEQSGLNSCLSPGAWGPPGDTSRAREFFRRLRRGSAAERTDPCGRTAAPSGPPGERGPVDWGEYSAAVHRWETITGRPAPHPTQPGRHSLAPAIVEWLMGLPPGWVTAAHLGLPRGAQLRALGSGVLPAQAAHALRLLVGDLACLHGHPLPVAARAAARRGKPRSRGPANGPGGSTRPPSGRPAAGIAARDRRGRFPG
uniref:hypothetical protein n=1 Tax=Amycolatopsis sp. CA-096443 TaxID=3239919 RepID=UPI003F494642